MPAHPKPTSAWIDDTVYRPLCTRCLRAEAVCLCGSIHPFAPFFTTVLLQHPKERRNTIGTARFTHLTLSNSLLIAGAEFDTDPAVDALLRDPENYSVVLFPGETAMNVAENRDAFLETIPKRADGRSKQLVIFVIDGTWSHAKGMLRRSTRLASLPRVSFTIETPSQYKVRKQPSKYCLSTVEATARLVKLLDPSAPSDRLIDTFATMVDAQLECATRGRLREEAKWAKQAQVKTESSTAIAAPELV